MDLITTHLNADFDGLASMVAARKLYPGAALVFPGGSQEAVRGFLAVHDLGISRMKDLNLDQVTRLILVDTQDPDRLGPLKALCGKPEVALHLYDHHPNAQEQGNTPAAHIEHRLIEPVGATTTLMIERLQARSIPLTPFEATILALGLYEETGSLAYASTTPRDLEAAAVVLRAGADLNMVSDTLRRHLDPDEIALLNDLLQSSRTFYLNGCKVLVASSTYDRYRGDLATAVHRLAEMEGLDGVLAAIAMQDKVAVIGRSRRPEFDVGAIAREFGGGGHAVAASASVKGQTVVEVRDRLERLLIERFPPTQVARDVMTQPVKCVTVQTTVEEAERRMTQWSVSVLPVLDAQERYLGLISREIVQKALFHGFAKATVDVFMQVDQYTAGPDTAFREIEAAMVERNQRFVPILHKRTVLGVITRTDLLRAMHGDLRASGSISRKGEEPAGRPSVRNVSGLMTSRLPDRIVRFLRNAGALGDRSGLPVYAVGGFVRDLLLGIENLDVDLVVEGDGIAFARSLAGEEGARVTVHDRFGTAVLLFSDGFKLDVATARTEYYEYPTALPTVERSSIKKDLYRRDFTINTLAVQVNARRFGDLIDFFGGQRDLNDKIIRVLHSLSFVEDPTRVFRAVRFEQRFGFRLSKDTLALIKSAVAMDLFHRLSGHRLLEELILLLSEAEPRRGLMRLGELDLLRFIQPQLAMTPRLQGMLKAVEDVLDWYRLLYLDRPLQAWVVYLLALFDALPGKGVERTLARLAIPARHAAVIRTARAKGDQILKRLLRQTTTQPATVYRILEGLPDEVLLLLMAKTRSEAVKRHISAYVTKYRQVKPLLSGRDLQALGLKPGPMFRRILDRLRDARINGEVLTQADERALVKRLAKIKGFIRKSCG